MKYAWALDCIIREVVIADLILGIVHVLKAEFNNGFYQILMIPTYAPKLGLVYT